MVDDAHDGDDILYGWSQRSHGFTDTESAADREELGCYERLVQFFLFIYFLHTWLDNFVFFQLATFIYFFGKKIIFDSTQVVFFITIKMDSFFQFICKYYIFS